MVNLPDLHNLSLMIQQDFISYIIQIDSLGMILVSQPLTSDNYSSWSPVMMITLSVKNKLGFVSTMVFRPITQWAHDPFGLRPTWPVM